MSDILSGNSRKENKNVVLLQIAIGMRQVGLATVEGNQINERRNWMQMTFVAL